MIDLTPERVFTEPELGIIWRNVYLHDQGRSTYKFRCRMEDCKYVIQDVRIANAVPLVGIVCQACWEMHQAIRYTNIKGN